MHKLIHENKESHCPVCGMKVFQQNFLSRYQHKPYFFCSLLCKQSFDGNPHAYLDMKIFRVDERNQELELIRKETITCLSKAAEYKDNEMGKHTFRIGAYSQKLALLVGLDDSLVQLIHETAPMHDVGKIGIPERILLKAGLLDAEERKIIETHSEIGARILGVDSKSKLMQMAASIALNHHEKWNGQGYPNALKGLAIPIEGRVVAICDVFDALVSVRPYKKAWSFIKVKEFMATEKGQHFDPHLIQIFMDHYHEFCEIYDRLKDSYDS